MVVLFERSVYDERGVTLLRREEAAVTTCGQAFCENCGDCLYCYAGDDCMFGVIHRWVMYEDELGEAGK